MSLSIETFRSVLKPLSYIDLYVALSEPGTVVPLTPCANKFDPATLNSSKTEIDRVGGLPPNRSIQRRIYTLDAIVARGSGLSLQPKTNEIVLMLEENMICS